VKVCIIGGTGHYSYALSAISAGEPGVRIAGIAPGSTNEPIFGALEAANRIGQRPEPFDDYVAMLDKADPDIAVVAPFFGDHARVASECLRRGIHVFMDKPVATSFEDLDALREAHARSGASLAAMFGIRYTGPFLAAYDAIRNGAVGSVRLMHAQKSYKLGARGDNFKIRALYGGTIPWVGAHAIDWLRWLSGAAFESVFAAHSTEANRDHGDLEASASCLFEMSGGISATISVDYLRPATAPTHGDDRIRIVGSDGALEVSGGAVTLIGPDAPGIRTLPLPRDREIFSDFLAQVRGEHPCMVSAEDSFAVTEASLKARLSADEHRIVRWDKG
jgi:predicted dehydrogenase